MHALIHGLRWAAALLLLLGACVAQSQELEPRAYSASPVGTSFVVAGYGRTRGDVVFDSSSAFTDVEANVDTASLGFGRVFGIAGRQASVAVALPYSRGDASGSVGEDRRSVSRSGVADIRLRFSALLLGGPALRARDFASRAQKPKLGASVLVVVPNGQYAADRLVNVGTNRWAVKPELGYSHPHGPWQADFYVGAWLFGDNDEFLGSQRREQRPVLNYHGSVSYTLRPGTWAAIGATWFSGGATSVDGVRNADKKDNLRLGVTLSVAAGRGHSIKFYASDGAVTRVGGDFRSLGVAWQYAWFD
jgi:hypothetical protein